MNKEYQSSYVDFRQRAGILIRNVEMLTQRLGEQEVGNVAREVKKPEPKPENP